MIVANLTWTIQGVIIPTLLKKSEGDIVITFLRLSVCPSVMLSPPKPLDEIQPNLVCKLLTWMGRATAIFFCPAPWVPGEGSKGQISFNFNYKVNFKNFYTKLCVCSHKSKIQNISDRIFILSPGSCPRGGTSVRSGCPGGKNFFFFFKHGHVAYQIDGDAKQNIIIINAYKTFILGSNWWPWGELKRSNIIKFGHHVNFKDFCVFSQMKYTKHIRWDFHSVACVMPQGWNSGVLGVPRGSKIIFLKHGHVAYQIEENRIQVKFHPRVKLVILGWGQKIKY